MTVTSQVLVPDAQTLESAVASYIAQGFTVQNRTPDGVLLFKKKEFSVVWAVVGFLICFLPLLVYLIVYATQNDQMVEIRIGNAAAAPAVLASGTTWSDDGQYWWDGQDWQPVATALPPGTQRSEDGAYYWNGTQWIAIGPTPPKPDATS